MSFSKLLDANLVRAFNLVKDLAVTVTFTKKSGTNFDFGEGDTVHSGTVSVTIKAVVLNTDKKASQHNVVAKEIMFKSKDIGQVTEYDSVLLNGEMWSVGPQVKDNGRILVLNVFREV